LFFAIFIWFQLFLSLLEFELFRFEHFLIWTILKSDLSLNNFRILTILKSKLFKIWTIFGFEQY
jgi:hypothetical protein